MGRELSLLSIADDRNRGPVSYQFPVRIRSSIASQLSNGREGEARIGVLAQLTRIDPDDFIETELVVRVGLIVGIPECSGIGNANAFQRAARGVAVQKIDSRPIGRNHRPFRMGLESVNF